MRFAIILFFSLFAAELKSAQGELIHRETFIRDRGTYMLDEAGSSIEVIAAKDGKPSLALDFRRRDTNSTSSNKMSFDESGILRGPGWFVFVESPDRLWIFDGKDSLAIVERSATGNATRTNIKDFDAQSAAICPVKVKEALPQKVRDKLFQKRLF